MDTPKGASRLDVVASHEVPIRLMIVSDLDNTMVDHKDKENSSLLEFSALWSSEFSRNSILVYSTGRSPTLYRQLRKQVPLLTPDITILSVGTEIMYGASMEADEGWEKFLNEGWNRDVVAEEASKYPQLRPQSDTEQRPHKLSFHVEKTEASGIIPSLEGRLKDRGLKAKIIYSGGYDLDILPERAGKGRALAYLLGQLQSLGRLPSFTLACGDSGNDAELFEVEGAHGVIVGNAMEELVQWHQRRPEEEASHVHRATARCAAGIMEAVRHFNVSSSVSPRAAATAQLIQGAGKDAPAAIVAWYVLLENWIAGGIEKGKGQEAFFDLLHPTFSWFRKSGEEASGPDFRAHLLSLHGERQGKGVRIWVDRLRCTGVASKGKVAAKYHVRTQLQDGTQSTQAVSAVLDVQDSLVTWCHLHESPFN